MKSCPRRAGLYTLGIGKPADVNQDGETYKGLEKVYDEFYDAGFYWGADFNNFEDPPHFEASEEMLTQWKNEGFLNADADFSDLPQFKSPYPGDEGEPYKNDGTSNYNENVDIWQRRAWKS
ncbi:MAG: hypothetical protein BRC37_05795 [Cyanobacteria bacterium QH_3_48_40]|nr:MAG: hypothetical protein BRC37_05795 [Cyanobacteria bacterium QH_3_48_40]